jgi:hypothetical protein
MPSFILTIDVAHPPRHPDRVEAEILAAWGTIRNSSTLRVLKIIHGRGLPDKGARTRDLVRNWVFQNRNRFRAVVEGEDFNVYNVIAEEMLKDVGNFGDPDLGSANSGVTFVWVK